MDRDTDAQGWEYVAQLPARAPDSINGCKALIENIFDSSMSNMAFKTFTVTLEKDGETGWITAQCLELPGAISQGRTRRSALNNVKEAIQAVLEARAKVLKEQTGRADVVEVKVRETASTLLA